MLSGGEGYQSQQLLLGKQHSPAMRLPEKDVLFLRFFGVIP